MTKSNNSLIIKVFALISFMPFLAFSQVKEGEVKFELVKKESRVIWRGTQAMGGGHEGTIQLAAGTLTTTAGKLTKGSFNIDMTSIDNTDIKPEKSSKELEDHLKSEDFFSVGRFPMAYFTINKITPTAQANKVNIVGTLNLKGITNQINFPATINISSNKITAQADITIYRTLWGIIYKSQNFLSSLKDDLISNEIKFAVNLVFTKNI